MKTQHQSPEKNNLQEVEKKQNSTPRKPVAEGKSEQDFNKSAIKQGSEKSDSKIKTAEKGNTTSSREIEKQDQKAKTGKDVTKR